jgi:hypothetical protein
MGSDDQKYHEADQHQWVLEISSEFCEISHPAFRLSGRDPYDDAPISLRYETEKPGKMPTPKPERLPRDMTRIRH